MSDISVTLEPPKAKAGLPFTGVHDAGLDPFHVVLAHRLQQPLARQLAGV
ncbi:hypothetical protein [Halomonas stenophila]|uniref:Uncharacterized protein n=1 Tax=Halomonas stenophila TaxID=795312 RepID=A0A7W5EWL9_9GAMM|nr:hypothetical protein [Halomonas stenophila]MBB3232342.1 hypothetical protein [Halomonas stenophila]